MKHIMFFILSIITIQSFSYTRDLNNDRPITIAILAKDKEHCLPLYLLCIENQTWPKNKTYLYIRTNNNNDNTAQILRNWIETVKDQYLDIYFDDSDVSQNIQQYGQHEWNCDRLKILGNIRNKSIQWAYEKNSHYFVVDCDNFIYSHTLENLLYTNLPIVAPLLYSNNAYSNYHAAIDMNGYNITSPYYLTILNREIKGLIEMPVVHCTYLVRYEIIPEITYDDESYRYEYVIFSDSARKKQIPQYLDTREVYGYLTFAENSNKLVNEPWFLSFSSKLNDQINKKEK